MRKTLFSKHFVTVASIILLSITILGAVLLVFAAQYFKQDRYKLLEHNAHQAAALTYSNIRNNSFERVTPQVVLPMYTILANSIESDIYLANTEGELLLFAEGTGANHVNQTISKAIIEKASTAGGYQELGKMGGLYPDAHYTVGISVNRDDGTSAAVVFVSASAKALTVFLKEILKMFMVSSLAVLILAFAAVYFITADLVRPLRKMVAATQSFSKGDFTVRVPVESYDELGQLAISFNNMASSLATTETTRRSFTANVSHELRTPMTTIGGFIDGILDGTIPDDKRDYYLNIVSQEIKRLSRLVRSMLNIARIEAGELEIKPDLFDVNDTVIRTVFTFEQPLEAKNIEVRGLDHGKVMVEADPDLIHQVIYNLIENAVKFASEGGYIEVEYTEDDVATSVSIKNSGDGIPKDEIPHVFDRFYKTDKSRSRDKGGAGLGLHIVRSIINLHGGDIIVRSVEGEYCEFVFTIPKPQKKKKEKEKEPRLELQ
ncbi:HAMP domain-containing sensor histidine kinase [Marasmitruncus massiliensis]|uniref:HAMP domain-containing sensor histidine kinase n=1 Tax=Marasmitruncus massiliensis TaxID=1944642 RepID=UPI000C7965C6|nr:HAMP domain-containing sensor histidine kinase [Marasmitruncus massiliensis]